MSFDEHDYDKYLALNFTDLKELPAIDRRDFLKTLGGGILIFIAFGDLLPAQENRRRGGFGPPTPTDFNAFLRIGEDGRVTCFTGKIEMGQGIHTSLPQMLADELQVSLDQVDIVMGDTDLCPWDMGTFGSMSTRFFGPILRKAAAEARTVLIELAAEELHLPEERLVAENGAIVDREDPEARRTYAALAKGKRIDRTVQGEVELENPTAWTIMGRPTVRRDARDKVTGRAQYAADIRLPGLRYAAILRPPAHDSTLVSADTSFAESMDGVRVLRDGDFVAVLHPTPDGARAARDRIEAKYETPESTLDAESIFEHLLSVAPDAEVAAASGSLDDGARAAMQIVEGTYRQGYVAHAPMEPHAATAQFADGRLTVWASTQTPFRARDTIAGALGLDPKNVRVITPFVGGGFGGKSHNGQALEAAKLARMAGCPVQVAWSRAEEFFYDAFQPASIVKVRGGVDAEGRLTLWDYAVYFAGARGAEHYYSIPNHRTVLHGSGWRGAPGSHPFITGAWRAPGNNTNTFARESHIDRLALAAGIDPLEFRLRHLEDPILRRTIQVAAAEFGWTPSADRRDARARGRGVGIACSIDAGSYSANIVEVTVDRKSGAVRVERVVSAQSMGQVINPEGATMQMEGCITMGLGYCLSEELQFRGGAVDTQNFDTYEIPRFSWIPTIDTVLVDDDRPPQGGGEPAIVPMGAAVANAVADATGARIERLPITRERVRAALE